MPFALREDRSSLFPMAKVEIPQGVMNLCRRTPCSVVLRPAERRQATNHG
jgi:hypothetical protein